VNGHLLNHGGLVGHRRQKPEIPSAARVDSHEPWLNRSLAGAGMTLIPRDRGGGFSSRRRAEAIDSESRNRDVTGPPAGMRVRKGVFGEQPQRGMLDVSIGWPRAGGVGRPQDRPQPGRTRQRASIVASCVNCEAAVFAEFDLEWRVLGPSRKCSVHLERRRRAGTPAGTLNGGCAFVGSLRRAGQLHRGRSTSDG
jgi:hypothetical protein